MQTAPHPEDIKAALRKLHHSIAEFERVRHLPERSVKDVLRGKSRPTIARAIAVELGVPVHELFPDRFKSPDGDNSSKQKPLHRLNRKGK